MGLKEQVMCGTDMQWAELMARAGISPETFKDMKRHQRGGIEAANGSNWGGDRGLPPDRFTAYLPLQPDLFPYP